MSIYPDSVLAQKEAVPAIYRNADFSLVPERFTKDLSVESSLINGRFADRRQALLADEDTVELIKAYTMTGDGVADAYAALIPQYGLQTLIGMLEEACDKGIEALQNPPQELVDFIRHMEKTPDWLDMALVEQGAKEERINAATLFPFAIRGAFFATFLNKYTALPMAMTGALSGRLAAKRVFETASFFTTSTLPGALGRYGEGFKAAAKVRLMHSMVRFHAMSSDKWDFKTYGIPIPQVDQMPAGLIGVFILSQKVLKQGRTEFNAEERAILELARYRCYLLGLPEDLLAETPEGIMKLWLTRSATIRHGFDDATCGELIRQTMAADLRRNPSLWGAVENRLEQGFSKLFLLKNFCAGDADKARSIGVELSLSDWLAAFAALLLIVMKKATYKVLRRTPGLSAWSERRLIARVHTLLGRYGKADFVTDSAKYSHA